VDVGGVYDAVNEAVCIPGSQSFFSIGLRCKIGPSCAATTDRILDIRQAALLWTNSLGPLVRGLYERHLAKGSQLTGASG
jgi:hypothetical protein